jgi:peptidoglycan/xylan/chitin deacetylase (PgdA/CDA1 family)
MRSRLQVARAHLVDRAVRSGDDRVGVVLVYHRVEPGAPAAAQLAPAIATETLRRELAYLSSAYRVVPPSELLAAVDARGRGAPVPAAVTFDDDTRSHVDVALPILDELGLTAAFFVGGWSVTRDVRPWWETLQLAADHDRLVALAGSLPSADGGLAEIGRIVEEMPARERLDLELALDEVTSGLPRDPGLDPDALRTLAHRHEIGFHTVAHHRLPRLGSTELERALTDGRAELERIVGREVTSVAYPHGAADARVAAAAAAAGFSVGFAGGNRAVGPGDGPLLVPRLDPWRHSLGSFAITLATAARQASRS